MAGDVAAGHHVTLEVRPAGPADDAALRRLLRETPMDGEVQVAFAREPDFFRAAAVEGETTTVAAWDEDRVVALFSRSVRDCWVDGAPARLPYLSALRIAPGYRQSRRLLQLGFDWVRRLEEAEPDTLRWSITTVVSDNTRARRLLEAHLPGLPRYVPQEELVTLAATPWRRLGARVPGVVVRSATAADEGDLGALLGRWGRRHELGPAWDGGIFADPVRGRGLSWADVTVASRGGRLVGCVATWDQRPYKQTLVTGYGGHLRFTRRLVNVLAPLLRTPHLPPPGGELRHATLSHLAVDDDDPDVLTALVAHARDRVDAGHLTTMLAGRHPLLRPLRALLRPREYRSTLYRVGFGAVPAPGGRVPHLEVAVL